MTREQAIEMAGIERVETVEGMDCDFTNRVTTGTEWDGFCEFSASVPLDDGDYLTAFYYQKNEDVNATEDLGSLTWVVDHYEIY